MRMKTFPILLAALVLAVQGAAWAERPMRLSPKEAAEIKKMVLPQKGENPFWQVEWLEDIWEARQKAAAEGKPIFVWSGSEGAPITNC